MTELKACIVGLEGTSLNQQERHFIKAHNPWGFILFSRNIAERAALIDLTQELRDLTGRNVPIFIDQEGGRVQRLKPPLAPLYPSARKLGSIFLADQQAGMRASWLMSRLHAFDLKKLGINANCLPVLDIPCSGSHDVIGDRAYGDDSYIVLEMGKAAAQGLIDGGVLPVMKHIPGHGRAGCDTHLALAHVASTRDILNKTDFVPFKSLSYLPAAMTAHIVYDDIDPLHCATLSSTIIQDVIRQDMGFEGLLMTDDLSMKALSGTFAQKTSEAMAAGCDICLHCNGNLAEMEEIAQHTPPLLGHSLIRAKTAEQFVEGMDDSDEGQLRAEFDKYLKDLNPK